MVDPDAPETDVRLLSCRLEPGLAGYAVMVLLGLFLPRVAVFGYPLVAVNLLVPLRPGARRRA